MLTQDDYRSVHELWSTLIQIPGTILKTYINRSKELRREKQDDKEVVTIIRIQRKYAKRKSDKRQLHKPRNNNRMGKYHEDDNKVTTERENAKQDI